MFPVPRTPMMAVRTDCLVYVCMLTMSAHRQARLQNTGYHRTKQLIGFVGEKPDRQTASEGDDGRKDRSTEVPPNQWEDSHAVHHETRARVSGAVPPLLQLELERLWGKEVRVCEWCFFS